MKRYALLPMVTDAQGNRAPAVPAAAAAWVTLHDFGARALVKLALPDGTAKTATTIADVIETTDEDGTRRQVDVDAEPLTPAQRATIKTMLTNAGFDVSQFDADGIDDRAQLLRFVLRRLARWQDMPSAAVLAGWDTA